MASIHANVVPYLSFNHFQTPPSSCLVGAGIVQHGVSLSNYRRKVPCIKCEKKDDEEIQHVSVERPPYYSYLDSTSGQLEPASGARASILGQEYWPEGTASRVRAARAPAPTAESSTSPMSPSYGAKPGSFRLSKRDWKEMVQLHTIQNGIVVENIFFFLAVWGGDPVYPTVNYIQDPNEVIDYRGPDFHEPMPNMVAYLKEQGKLISREEFDKIMAKEKTEQIELTEIDEAMAKAVDI
ncbi:Protein PLASTID TRANSCRIPTIONALLY ACTIVE 12, chloroplastic [Glycine max]|nr:Protein PLASTID TRANSCRIPTIONALLY ACTIVE 12, chloroplastic [Glycine max]